MGAIFELIVELLLNGFGEIILELLVWVERGREELHPVTRTVLCLVAGLLLGRMSLELFANPLIHSPTVQQWNLLCAPLFVGALSWLISTARQRAPTARAIAAAVFAFAFALMRLHRLGVELAA